MQYILGVSILNTYSMDCIHCGICCTRYQAIVSLEEVQQIASYLHISMNECVKLYCEPRWHSHYNYLIRHVNESCIFLKYSGNISYCDIQPIKPSCCRNWIPSPENKECKEGLRKNIGYSHRKAHNSK